MIIPKIYRMRVKWTTTDWFKEHNVWILVLKGNPRNVAINAANWRFWHWRPDFVICVTSWHNPFKFKLPENFGI